MFRSTWRKFIDRLRSTHEELWLPWLVILWFYEISTKYDCNIRAYEKNAIMPNIFISKQNVSLLIQTKFSWNNLQHRRKHETFISLCKHKKQQQKQNPEHNCIGMHDDVTSILHFFLLFLPSFIASRHHTCIVSPYEFHTKKSTSGHCFQVIRGSEYEYCILLFC